MNSCYMHTLYSLCGCTHVARSMTGRAICPGTLIVIGVRTHTRTQFIGNIIWIKLCHFHKRAARTGRVCPTDIFSWNWAKLVCKCFLILGCMCSRDAQTRMQTPGNVATTTVSQSCLVVVVSPAAATTTTTTRHAHRRRPAACTARVCVCVCASQKLTVCTPYVCV